MQTLAAMLEPCGLEEFLTNYWTEKAIFIPSGDREKFSNLFDWKKLNYLLEYHNGDNSLINLVINGRKHTNIAYKKSELIESIKNGATLRVNRVDERIPEVADFASKIRYELGCKTHINVYCSSPGKQGFDCHYDPYEIFILQIDGKKEWHVFQETIIKYPLKYSIALPPNSSPYLSCTLNPGDVLYIPRGHLHYAVAVDRPSLHLTMGIRCPTGIDFLEWLVDKLRQKEEFRKSLPIPTRENASLTMGTCLESLSQELDEYIINKDIESEYIKYLTSLQQPITECDLSQQLGVTSD